MHSETIMKWSIGWFIWTVTESFFHLPSKFRNQHWFIYLIYKLSPKIIYVPDRDHIHTGYLYILNSYLKEKLFSAFACLTVVFKASFNSSYVNPSALISRATSDLFSPLTTYSIWSLLYSSGRTLWVFPF